MTQVPVVATNVLYLDASQPVEGRVQALLEQMTLAEKIGQMTQVEKNSITPEAVREYGIGSVLSGGGGNPTPNSPESWAEMVSGFLLPALKTRLGIPLVYGVDAVHGHNNVRGAVIFPHNVGLGAARDAGLVERVARVTAREILATGVHWDFAPSVAVPQDIRWGRTYEGFGERTELVSELAAAYIRGLQGERLDAPEAALASAKHFVADGGTSWGSSSDYAWIPGVWKSNGRSWKMDQGRSDIDEATLRRVHLPSYQVAIEAGARCIMVSYSSWGGLKMHAHHYLLTEVLKGEMGFSGFLISDWMAIDQISSDYEESLITSINAGLDMVMVPFDYQRFIAVLTAVVERGAVPMERIDDAVRRILTVKLELGLFERPLGAPQLLPQVGSDAHRLIAREAVSQSLVLLKNEGSTLPLAKTEPRLLVAGEGASDIGLQCGGWTVDWMGALGAITTGTTLLEAIQATVSDETELHFDAAGQFDGVERGGVGIVVLHELPYAEGEGDSPDLALSPDALVLLERVRAQVERLVVVLFSGRPVIVTEYLPHCDAFVAAWLPGTEGQGVADGLFGNTPIRGKLPYTWPRTVEQLPFDFASLPTEGLDAPLFPFGYGLSTLV